MPSEEQTRRVVRETYANLARTQKCGVDCCPQSRGTKRKSQPACGLSYSDAELSAIPPRAREIGAGCGNPVALAEIKPGNTVLDLGSGGGADVFLASSKTGQEGRVIGVDSTPEMVWRAREAAQESGCRNVEFRLGEIEHLPVESSSVDFVISNCVINLSPDKDAAFREAFRVLRSGGRLAISDIVISGALPEEVRNSPRAWASCVSGAISEKEYLKKISDAGFTSIEVRQRVAVPWKAIGRRLPRSNGSAGGRGKERRSPASSFEIISEEIVATKPSRPTA